ncbi:MAG TPA: sulfatase-like hydrolase/transferase [Burkholderiaceae bacterium]|nr:sulfatase-like hydrolase/transferase [Burkholderiaceae bacterium]
MHRMLKTFGATALAALALTACDSNDLKSTPPPQSSLPNILFVVLDDFGVDQLPIFGYGGATAARTPNIDAIARAGLRFRNAWSMPTCSPTRATFFEGRYPFRTHVRNAIVADDLANSQVSPFEFTTPKVLKEKGYINAVIGKMHLSGSDLNPDNNPLGHRVMYELGWDHFEGYLDGGPFPLDTTAGGVAPEGTHGCGFVPSQNDDPTRGADSGACYMPDDSCSSIDLTQAQTPGRLCMERGGIFDPGASCRATRPSYIDFTRQNGYYTAEWIISDANGNVRTEAVSAPGARGYRVVQETDRALAWLRQQNSEKPWMLSVGYSAIHTPLQQPPVSLLPSDSVPTSGFSCDSALESRVITNQMIEALDKEIGRLMVESGLARYNEAEELEYRPEDSNTVVIIMGDNGTYAPSVKAPFNPTRAKGFPYQTGVWVPLIVAGPMVAEPGRSVPHMVNSTDLFSLFAELAEVNLDEAVTDGRPIDAQPLLPYLVEPSSPAIRTVNYTEMGTNIKATNTEPPSPCVIPASNICVQLFPQQAVCADQGGTWYGPDGAAGPEGLSSCCAVNDYLLAQGETAVDIMPESQRALRNATHKLVQLERLNCSTMRLETVDELYAIDEAIPVPRLDNAVYNLLTQTTLPSEVQQQYDTLKAEMQALLDTNAECPGDGNRDGIVDAADIDAWTRFSQENGGKSSWYDFNLDGVTDHADLLIIQENMGRSCRTQAS